MLTDTNACKGVVTDILEASYITLDDLPSFQKKKTHAAKIITTTEIAACSFLLF